MSVDILAERKGPEEKGQLWYPFAKIQKDRMKTFGQYKKGYPQGIVVHYTAGHQVLGSGSLEYGREQGFCFLLIDAAGVVHQAHPLNEWGYHAGKSAYAGLNGTVSDELLGIEIACAGKCEEVVVNGNKRYKAWFHNNRADYFHPEQVRYSKGEANIEAGWYQKYTPAQEKALIDLILWLKNNDPVGCFSFDMILGHDEVCLPKGRKQDPGASLSTTMPNFRKMLKSL